MARIGLVAARHCTNATRVLFLRVRSHRAEDGDDRSSGVRDTAMWRRSTRTLSARFPRLCALVASPTATTCRGGLPRSCTVHARLRAIGDSCGWRISDLRTGLGCQCAARSTRRRRSGGHHRSRLGRDWCLCGCDYRSFTLVEGGRHVGAALGINGTRIHRQPGTDSTKLVHVLLPASARRSRRTHQRSRVHRHDLEVMVAWIRIIARCAQREELSGRSGQPAGRTGVLPRHAWQWIPQPRPSGSPTASGK